MSKLLLYPGEFACTLAGLEETEHRQILRIWVNTAVWGLLGTVTAILLGLTGRP